MHEKNIKMMVTKQLKRKFPNWKRLTRRQKKALAKQVLDSVVKEYSFGEDVTAPLNELIGIPAIREAEIMTVAEMERFIADQNRHLFRLPIPSRKGLEVGVLNHFLIGFIYDNQGRIHIRHPTGT